MLATNAVSLSIIPYLTKFVNPYFLINAYEISKSLLTLMAFIDIMLRLS